MKNLITYKIKLFQKMKTYGGLFVLLFFYFGESQNRNSHNNMVFIKGGTFEMGADNNQANKDEYPKHNVTLSGFWMDITEVTNAQFAEFVKATNYITTAEKNIDWSSLEKQLPPNTPKPSDENLQPASLVFITRMIHY